MNLFHIPTFFLISCLLGFVMPAMVWFVLAGRRSPAVVLWCGGKILGGGMGSLLIGLRGHVPEWATFQLANLLLFIGLILRIQSLRRDLAMPRRTAWMMAAAVLFALGYEGISLGLGDALLRFQYNHVFFSALPLYLAALAWRIGYQEQSQSARWIAGVYLLFAIAMLNDLIWITTGSSSPDLMVPSVSRAALALTSMLGAVISDIAYVGMALDRSHRQAAEAEKRCQTIIATAKDGFFFSDIEGRIVDVNQSYCDMTGYRRDELLAMRVADVEANENPEEVQAHIRHIIEAGSDRFESWNRCKDGRLLQIEASVNFMPFGDGKFAVFIHDITKRKQAEEVIKQLAFYDLLTQLPNRRLLLDRLQQALVTSVRSKQYGALLFIDLDNFKTVNDTLGHDKGDLLLQEVASRISACARECDTLARLGGDEFVVLLTGLDGDAQGATAQAKQVGGKILNRLNQVYDLAGREHYGGASMGITLFAGHSSSMDELLKQADIALYQAKAAGRNTLRFFDVELQLALTARTALAVDLHHALARNQFELFCQIEASHNHKVIGVEALLRWHHPEHGLVPPQEFIPLAEEIGLIQPIGQWVLETACALFKSWEKISDRRHWHLAVNISVRQFQQPDFVIGVLKVLQDTGLDPSRLMLELTESVALPDINDAIVKMTALKEVGVRFSLDDFGTGFSSLSYLTRLPFDQLKIDRSFVQNIGMKPTDEVIIETIITMADNLEIGVVAEGVETEAQRAFLERHGCPACQGYLFGKPVPMAEFEENIEFAMGLPTTNHIEPFFPLL